ncbi:MAG: VanW family protein [Actinomycetota bacterium]
MIERRRPRERSFRRSMSRLFLLIIVLFAFIIHSSALFAVADYAFNRGRIHYGVSIYTQNVSQSTRAEAKSAISAKAKKAAAKNLRVEDANGSWPVEVLFLKPAPDIEDAVNEAYLAGRQGGFLPMLVDRARLYLKPRTIQITSKVNEEYVKLTTAKIAGFIDKPAQDATVEISGETATVRSAKNGWEVKQASLRTEIITHAADFSSRTISVPQGVAKVKVHDADAGKARLIALKMMKEPIEYTINNKEYVIDPAKIGTLIEFLPVRKKIRKAGKTSYETVLTATMTKNRLEQYFIPLKDEFEVRPVNARFEAAEGVVDIVPGINGLVIDMDSAVKDINKLALEPPPRKATLKMKNVEPELSTAKAQSMGIKERVSVHTENFEFTPNRSQNIGTLAEALDGMLVAPGQVWSINEATGPRTAAKGYTEAPVIVNGQLSPDIGGGICNVSTTIFNTVFFGGYEAVDRYPHEFYISHYPDGRDASIYYDGGMDFKFKNDSPYFILIKTDHTNSSVTVAFYSTNMGTDVSYSDTGFTNIVPYGIVYKDDPTVPTGYEKDADMGYGVDGRDISVFRTVKRGGNIYREDKFISHYEPKQRIVLKGTGPALPPGTPPPADLRPLGQTPR